MQSGDVLAAAPRPLKAYRPGRFGQIHYRYVEPKTATRKPPLLCLHPSPMSSLVYGDLLPFMGTDRLVVAADTPGYGLSDRPAAPPSIGDYAAAMGDLVDELGFDQFDVFAYHTGCATTVEMARQRPSQLRRIVLNSALMFSPEEIAEYRVLFGKSRDVSLGDRIAGLPERFRGHRAWWRDVPDENRAWAMFWESNRDLMHNSWGFMAAFDYDFPKALGETKQPVLILNPEDDLHEMTLRAQGVAPNGRMLELPGWTHGFLNAHPAEVADILRPFLDDPL